MSEIDELLLKQSLPKQDVVHYVYRAVSEYDAYLRDLKRDADENMKTNVKTLMGLLKFNKFDINNLNLELTVALSLILDWYRKILENDIFVIDNLQDKATGRLDYLLELEDKKASKEAEEKANKIPLSDEKLIAINRVNNKKKLDEAHIDSYGRRIIYEMLDKWIEKYCVKGEKGKPGEYKTRHFHLKFIAKINDKGEHIYKINEVQKI